MNDGMATEGPAFEKIVSALRAAGAQDVIYVNSVAAAMSGLLPGYPPIYRQGCRRGGAVPVAAGAD